MDNWVQAKLFLAATVLNFLYSASANAEWLCKEGATQSYGNTYIACGVGSGELEEVARKNALNSAKNEFEFLCKQTPTCRDYERTVRPMRSQCGKNKDIWKCYRAIEYGILPHKKENIVLDEEDIINQISAKRETLRKLRSRVEKEKTLNQLESQINRTEEVLDKKRSLEQIELEIFNLEQQMSRSRDYAKYQGLWSVGVGFSIQAGPSLDDIKSHFGINFSIHRYVSNYISPYLEFGLLSDFNEEETKRSGDPNSESTFEKASVATPLVLGIESKVGRLRLSPHLGYWLQEKSTEQVSYNAIGIGTVTKSDSENKRLYFGVSVKYNLSGYMIQLGAEKYSNFDDIGASFSIGLRY